MDRRGANHASPMLSTTDMAGNRAWHGVGLTDRGLVRQSNQDTFAVMNHLGLWVVADGMGGHAGGEVASRLAVESVMNHIQAVAGETTARPPEDAEDESLVRQAIETAQQAVLNHARAHPALTGMGTTIVVLRISSGPTPRATLAHVGDSRAYRRRAGTLTLLTRDHSLVEEYIRQGLMSSQEAFTHPLRHVLTRAIGIEGAAEPDISTQALQPDDVLLLCTDGLTKMMTDEQIATTLHSAGTSPEPACRALVGEAIRFGGNDNVTVVVCTAST